MTSESTNRIKPISSIPNTIFIIYLVISFVIYHFTHAKYYDFRSFYLFIFRYIGFSIVPIFFTAIYNMKKGKTVFGIISIIVSIISIMVILLGSYGQYVSK